jgi:hypothetical protein
MQQPDTNPAPGAGPLRPPGWRQDLLDLLRQDWHGERKQLQEAILHLAAGLDENTRALGQALQALADLRAQVAQLPRSTWNNLADARPTIGGTPQPAAGGELQPTRSYCYEFDGLRPPRCVTYPPCMCGLRDQAAVCHFAPPDELTGGRQRRCAPYPDCACGRMDQVAQR